ncbi:hypothetical protein BC936DRAFT_139665 [Jimgerdemannia flammicorona]|uniref:Uncharacterized protein n=1 Tax=Jimgerdemannia flammicorona TaxID=994334 RepID=A0A433B9H6_9FUNG|nr:hypothetical protein BC936DRAFT_139665 [Jimgerdemannia flammicorona]
MTNLGAYAMVCRRGLASLDVGKGTRESPDYLLCALNTAFWVSNTPMSSISNSNVPAPLPSTQEILCMVASTLAQMDNQQRDNRCASPHRILPKLCQRPIPELSPPVEY